MKQRLFIIFLFILISEVNSQVSINDIDQYVIKARKDWGIPGMAVGIVKNGEVLLSRGYGVKEAGGNKRVDDHTLFAIASNTKAFTAAALATLVSDGKLSWSDPVKKHLSDFELYDHYVTMETTIEDLLCHRVGLGTYSGDLMWYKSNMSPSALLGRLKYVPKAYGFRDGYGYSNLMFITAGEIIQQVTGKPWDQYIDSAFFKPLSMEETITSINALSGLENVASPHKPFEGGNQVIDWVNWDNMGAAGGIISNVHDMSNWMLMQLNQGIYGVDTLIMADQHQQMWSVHNPMSISSRDKVMLPGISFKGYGLGWKINNYRGKTMISHGGGYDGMYSKVILIPEENLGIVILTNSMVSISDPLSQYIIDRFLGAEEVDWSGILLNYQGNGAPGKIEQLRSVRAKKTKPTLRLEAYKGTFYSGMHGKVMITSEGKSLRLEFEQAPKLNATLTHWHDDTWEIHWNETQAWFDFGLLQFLIDTDRSVKGIHFDVPNNDIFFDELDLIKLPE